MGEENIIAFFKILFKTQFQLPKNVFFVILYYLETVERFEHGGVYGLQPGLFDAENMDSSQGYLMLKIWTPSQDDYLMLKIWTPSQDYLMLKI